MPLRVGSLAPLALALAACAASVEAGSPEPASDASSATDAYDAPTTTATACPGRATTWLRVDANLDATSVAPPEPWDPGSPAATSNFSTAANVRLAGGAPSQLTVYFRRERTGWSYHVMYDPASTPDVIAYGTLDFDAHGALGNAATLAPVPLPDPRAGGTTTLDLDFGPEIRHDGSIASGLTSIGASSDVSDQRNDGCAPSVAPCPLAPMR